tara:strand:+ start:423 stop:710 length:288 start_codon:yes stop_codon:yes gene_type:complete
MGHNYYTDGLVMMAKSSPIFACTVRCQCRTGCPHSFTVEEINLTKLQAERQIREEGWAQVERNGRWYWVSPHCTKSLGCSGEVAYLKRFSKGENQ